MLSPFHSFTSASSSVGIFDSSPTVALPALLASSAMSASPPTPYPQSIPGASLSSGLALPIPARPPGFRLGSPSAPIQVELFIDLQCPFSAKAFTTSLSVHQTNPTLVSFTFIPMCLPTHRQAYHMLKSSLTAALRGAELNPGGASVASTWIRYVDFLYRQVDRFSSAGHYENKTGEDLVNHCARCVLEFFKEEEERFDGYHASISGSTLEGWSKEPMRLAAKRVSRGEAGYGRDEVLRSAD